MKTCKKIIAVALVLMLAMAVMAPSAFAADYPSKGIYAINPWGAGGGTDNCLRAFCAALEKQLGQTITVDNLTGASGVIGHEAIADADPDGYTIGMITWELSSYVPQDMSEYTYENYIPICRVNTDAAAITVNTKWAADNNVTDLDSFVAYCKDHPGEVTMGGSSSGSVWHVGGGYLMNEAGIASGAPGAESRCLSVSMTMSSPRWRLPAQPRSKILTLSSSWPTPDRPSPT